MADVVLITGSSGGIGAATAAAFRAAGFVVVGYDRVAPDAAVEAGLAMPGQEPAVDRHVVGDATDEGALADAVAAGRELGALRHVIGIAGGALPDEVAAVDPVEVTLQTFRDTLESNTVGQWALLRAALPALRESGGDRSITFTSSINALAGVGVHQYSAAKAAKAALVSLARTLGVPLGPAGIRVNAVAPGTIRTPRTERLHAGNPDHFEAMDATVHSVAPGSPTTSQRCSCRSRPRCASSPGPPSSTAASSPVGVDRVRWSVGCADDRRVEVLFAELDGCGDPFGVPDAVGGDDELVLDVVGSGDHRDDGPAAAADGDPDAEHVAVDRLAVAGEGAGDVPVVHRVAEMSSGVHRPQRAVDDDVDDTPQPFRRVEGLEPGWWGGQRRPHGLHGAGRTTGRTRSRPWPMGSGLGAVASEVHPELWVSSMPEPGWDLAGWGVRLVVSLSEHLPPQAARRYEWATAGGAHGDGAVMYLHWPFEDGDTPDLDDACYVADLVALAVRRGRRVLVHCHEGRNRSGLVAALAVRRLAGLDGAAAVRIVRSARPSALSNRAFLAALEALPAH